MLLCSEDGGAAVIRRRRYVFLLVYMLYIYQNTGFFVQFSVSGLRSFKKVNYNKFTTDGAVREGFQLLMNLITSKTYFC